MNNRLDRERRSRAHRRASRGEPAGQDAAAPQADAAPPPRGRRLWLILLLCLVGSTAASFVVFKYVLVKIPPELVGTWQVTAGPLRGWTLEFRRDGTAIATRYERGQKIVTDYSAKVEGKSMWLTTRDEKTGKDDTVTQTIVELTAEELVIRDEDQITYHMKRVSN
jgi:uncharacterized protein (TIGR03066 family)